MLTQKKTRQRKARRLMIISCIRMCRAMKIKFDRKNMENIRDNYFLIFGMDKLVRVFDIASIVA